MLRMASNVDILSPTGSRTVFGVQAPMTATIVVDTLSPTGSRTGNIDDARQRADALLQRFATARAAGAADEDLLNTYLLPALEALADVGAQKELRDLTSQFEGWLAPLKQYDKVVKYLEKSTALRQAVPSAIEVNTRIHPPSLHHQP